MNLREACEEAIECLEMWHASNAERWDPGTDVWGSSGYEKISTVGTGMVINRIRRALADHKDGIAADQVAAWRRNYRVTLQTLHDENNALRAAAASLAAKLAAKEAPRSLLEWFFDLPKD
jgi:hypothetical protein